MEKSDWITLAFDPDLDSDEQGVAWQLALAAMSANERASTEVPVHLRFARNEAGKHHRRSR